MFLHGGPGLNTAAERAIFAAALDGRAPFIRVNLLGCGESRLKSPYRPSWDAQVDDVAAVARTFATGRRLCG